jgi:hypothetical protein
MSTVKHEMVAVGQVVVGFAVVALVMLGIGGTIYKVISPDGWVAQAFGRSFSAGTAALGSVLLIVVLAWFSRGWTSARTRNRFTELFVYTFAGAGLLYAAQFWTKGLF